MEKILIITWLYIGMYGYMYWISKRNKKHSRKWRTHEVNVIPMMAIFGPFSLIIGYILYSK
jgi:flagellar basal body-associated protein FliL